MVKKGKPVHGGNREREEKRAATASAATSKPDFTTPSGLVSTLLDGRSVPITARELAEAIGARDARRVTKAIEAERAAGHPICASCDASNPGFFLAQTPQELGRYIGSLRRRVKAVSRTLAALEATHDTWTGQQRLDLDDLEGGESE